MGLNLEHWQKTAASLGRHIISPFSHIFCLCDLRKVRKSEEGREIDYSLLGGLELVKEEIAIGYRTSLSKSFSSGEDGQDTSSTPTWKPCMEKLHLGVAF